MIWAHPENRGRRGRRLCAWLGWQVWERTVRRPRVVHLYDDVRMVCHPHDQVTSLALYCGLYDSHEMRFLLRWLRPGDTFLDVGSNVAPYSLLAASVDGVSAVAFEPGSLARERAGRNIVMNGFEGAITLVPWAVSDSEGQARLTADRWATNTLVGGDYTGDVEEVETVSLDSFIGDRRERCVSLVKIDVEGHEPRVLRGAKQLIASDRPALIVENNHPDALRSFGTANGYTPVWFDSVTGVLDELEWPTECGGNLVLVPDLDQARARLKDQVPVAHGARRT